MGGEGGGTKREGGDMKYKEEGSLDVCVMVAFVDSAHRRY